MSPGWGSVCPGGVCLSGCTPPLGQNSWHALVKTLPFRKRKLCLQTVIMEKLEFFINEKLYVYEKRTVCWEQDLLNTTYVTTVTIAKGHPVTDYSLNSKAYLQRWNDRGLIGYRVLDGRFEYRLLVIRIEYRLLDGRFEYRSLVVSTLDWYSGGLPFEFSILPLLKHACLKRWLVYHAGYQRGWQVSHHRWISQNTHHIHLR